MAAIGYELRKTAGAVSAICSKDGLHMKEIQANVLISWRLNYSLDS